MENILTDVRVERVNGERWRKKKTSHLSEINAHIGVFSLSCIGLLSLSYIGFTHTVVSFAAIV